MTAHPRSAASEPVPVRLFSPETPGDSPRPPGKLSPQMTLRELFSEAFLPLVLLAKCRKAASIRCYEESLDWWERLAGNLPLAAITDGTCAAFVASLAQQAGRRETSLARQTVIGHVGRLATLLKFAGPRTADKLGRLNRRILDDVPILEKPEAEHAPPHGDYSLADFQALWRACCFRRSPRIQGISAADWWRCLLLAAYYSGLRIAALMRLEWSDLDSARDELGGGWCTVRAATSKRGRGKRQYLHRELVAWLERLRGAGPRIFAYPGWEKNPRNLQARLTTLFRQAGVAKKIGSNFHGLRKLHANQSSLAGGRSEAGIESAQRALGHTSRRVTLGHYLSPQALDLLAAADINALPSPIPRESESQRRLFD